MEQSVMVLLRVILTPGLVGLVLVYWGLTPQQQPGSYQGGELMMMMKSVLWWRKLEYPEETTDLRQVTDETFHTYGLCPVRGHMASSMISPWSKTVVHVIMFEMMYVSLSKERFL